MGTASATPANLFAYSAATAQAAHELENFVRSRVTPAILAYSQTQSCPLPIDAMVLSRLRAILATDEEVKQVGQDFLKAGGDAASLLLTHQRVVTTDDALAAAEAALAAEDVERIDQGYPHDPAAARAALARLNDLMARNRGDSEFATSLLRQLGPRGLLNLLGKLAAMGHYDHSKGALPQVRTAQRGLSSLLAQATDPASPHHLDAGWTQALDTAAGRSVPVTPYLDVTGYQLLEPLLGNPGAHFSTPFLTTFGRDLLAYERSSPGGKPPWANPLVNRPMTNLISPGDAGYDPMVGLLEALGRNREAATELLDPHGGKSSTIEYLVALRGWPCDVGGAHTGQTALAEALRAAAATEPTDAAQRRIAAELVRALGDDLGGKVPGPLRSGVTDVLGAHMAAGNLNGAFGDSSSGKPTVFGEQYLRLVLADLAQDPGHYQHLASFETAYARLHFHADPDLTAASMGQILGALVKGRIDAVRSGHLSADARHNAAVDGISWAVNEALAQVPTKGTAAGLAMQGVQQLANRIEQHFHQDTSAQANRTGTELFTAGQEDVKRAVRDLADHLLTGQGQERRAERLAVDASSGYGQAYGLAGGKPPVG
ncbi:hypothetical protein ACFO3J_26670 [Streptomyces polygonati]|uniref:Uncharacterized protein n=1 Tax=Streptomyces polygonati TaxID=1617087 RepID=A0ABV8HVI0_9ACTN